MSHQISAETSGSPPPLSGSRNFALQSLECRCRGGGSLGIVVWAERAHHLILPLSPRCYSCAFYSSVLSPVSVRVWSLGPLPATLCCVWVHLFQLHPCNWSPNSGFPVAPCDAACFWWALPSCWLLIYTHWMGGPSPALLTHFPASDPTRLLFPRGQWVYLVYFYMTS